MVDLRASLPNTDDTFGVSGDFIAVMEHQDVGIKSQRIIIQKNNQSLLWYTDGSGQHILCDTLSGEFSCKSASSTISSEDTDTLLRVTARTAERLLNRSYDFTDYEDRESNVPTKQEGVQLELDMPESLSTLFPDLSSHNQVISECVMLFKEKKTEKETICYGTENLVSLYGYTQGSSIAPISIVRSLPYYESLANQDINLQDIKGSLEKDL